MATPIADTDPAFKSGRNLMHGNPAKGNFKEFGLTTWPAIASGDEHSDQDAAPVLLAMQQELLTTIGSMKSYPMATIIELGPDSRNAIAMTPPILTGQRFMLSAFPAMLTPNPEEADPLKLYLPDAVSFEPGRDILQTVIFPVSRRQDDQRKMLDGLQSSLIAPILGRPVKPILLMPYFFNGEPGQMRVFFAMAGVAGITNERTEALSEERIWRSVKVLVETIYNYSQRDNQGKGQNYSASLQSKLPGVKIVLGSYKYQTPGVAGNAMFYSGPAKGLSDDMQSVMQKTK
jgi:hypothetical protein